MASVKSLSPLRYIFPICCVLITSSLGVYADTAKTTTGINTKESTPAEAPLTLPEGFVPSKTKEGKDIPPGPTEQEKSWGDKATKQLEDDPKVKILDQNKDEKTKALYAKLNTIAKRLGRASARPLINYRVKIIDDTELNAFTLPNGNIYFFTGLLDILPSDDEIAAVMAHEISHNSCMHAVRGDKQAKKLTYIGMAAILAALAGGRNGANVASFSQYALAGIMSAYSVGYEKEADAAGVGTMITTGYNPSAMVTVMQRFEIEEKRHPKVELGIFQTHPYSLERVVAIEKQIKEAGLPFTPRDVSGAPEAVAVEDKDRIRVQWKNTTLMEFAQPAQSTSGTNKATLERAQSAAKSLNELIRDNLQRHEVHVVAAGRDSVIDARGVEIARVTPADAALQNLSTQQVAQKWIDNIGALFWREMLNGGMS
jgi:predicted Zn-dependent protease